MKDETTGAMPIGRGLGLVATWSGSNAAMVLFAGAGHCDNGHPPAAREICINGRAALQDLRTAADRALGAVRACSDPPVDHFDPLRGCLLWLLWGHQDGSSQVGGEIRCALSMDPNAELTDAQIAEAKRFGDAFRR